MLDISEIRKIDGAVADAIVAELERQQHNIELIASENIVSKAVMYTCLLYTSPSPRDRQ